MRFSFFEKRIENHHVGNTIRDLQTIDSVSDVCDVEEDHGLEMKRIPPNRC